ncbi:MAG: DsbA family protein [Hyphomicrobiaceae bacterium]
MSFSAILAAMRSRIGLVLLVPAVLLAGVAVVVGNNGPVRTPVAAASDETPPQRKAIEAIVKDYLLKNPEIMLEVQAALEIKMEKVQAQKTAAALKIYAGEIFRPAFSPIVGNPKGDVTIVEFFDYNCGFCKKALADVAKLIEQEKQVKVVLKELPILTKGSEEAAKVGLAAKMQGKYWEFHQAMLRNSGQANEASALRVAEKIGLDMPKLKKDMALPEVAKEIDDTRLLAEKLQVRGTPFFMIADRVIPGAPTDLLEQMAKHVAEVRQQGGCKVC